MLRNKGIKKIIRNLIFILFFIFLFISIYKIYANIDVNTYENEIVEEK